MVESRGLGRRLWLLTALSQAKSLTKPHVRLGLARLPALGQAMHITTHYYFIRSILILTPFYNSPYKSFTVRPKAW